MVHNTMGWSQDPGPSTAGKFPAFFTWENLMKELSVFIDESGDFGEYDRRSPYYIITMVFHDQSISIEPEIIKLNQQLAFLNLHDLCIHTGPIIRREEIYVNMDIPERRRIFNNLIAFVRQINIRYKYFYIEKKNISNLIEAFGKLSKQIGNFIREHYSDFLAFDIIKLYYDNGQVEVSKILSSVFDAMLPCVEFRKVMPENYKLFQVADLLCSLILVKLKAENNLFSKSELQFFGSLRDLNKNYLKPLLRKEWI